MQQVGLKTTSLLRFVYFIALIEEVKPTLPY
jgi:hypothetical protein